LNNLDNGLLDGFELFLAQNVYKKESFHPHFEKAMVEMFEAGGKRFRPLLLLSVVDAYEPLLLQNSFYVATAIEMLHTYSLIHDDLPTFDDSPLRRGKQTLHVTYGEVTATLVGDALNTDSFLMIAEAPLSDKVKVALIREFSKNSGSGGMVLGQAIDCFFEEKKLTIEQLKFLHIHKTAKLIAVRLKMGAIIDDLPLNQQNLLSDIGIKLGLLFQVQDDIIDATMSSDEAGKPTGNDTIKNSFTNLLGIDGAIKEKNILLNELFDDIQKLDKKLKYKLENIINRYFK
jgi:farnesyl diphosphate synthase